MRRGIASRYRAGAISSDLMESLHVGRELREEVYRAFLTRASSGDIDNTPVIDRILGAREEQAKLLGFSCFAEKSMASKVRELRRPAALHCSVPWRAHGLTTQSGQTFAHDNMESATGTTLDCRGEHATGVARMQCH